VGMACSRVGLCGDRYLCPFYVPACDLVRPAISVGQKPLRHCFELFPALGIVDERRADGDRASGRLVPVLFSVWFSLAHEDGHIGTDGKFPNHLLKPRLSSSDRHASLGKRSVCPRFLPVSNIRFTDC